MRAYTPEVPPDAWIIEELEKLRRDSAVERPGLQLPLPVPPEPPLEAPESETPEQSSGVVIIQL